MIKPNRSDGKRSNSVAFIPGTSWARSGMSEAGLSRVGSLCRSTHSGVREKPDASWVASGHQIENETNPNASTRLTCKAKDSASLKPSLRKRQLPSRPIVCRCGMLAYVERVKSKPIATEGEDPFKILATLEKCLTNK